MGKSGRVVYYRPGENWKNRTRKVHYLYLSPGASGLEVQYASYNNFLGLADYGLFVFFTYVFLESLEFEYRLGQLDVKSDIPLVYHDILTILDISFGIVVLVVCPRDGYDDLFHIIELLLRKRSRSSACDGDVTVIVELTHLCLRQEWIGTD